jgi:hypothetical protein
MSTLQPTLHKDSAFILQAMQRLFENKPNPSMLVPNALQLNMIPFLMHVLDGADLSEVRYICMHQPNIARAEAQLLLRV